MTLRFITVMAVTAACGDDPRTQVMLVVDGECGIVARADVLRVSVNVDGAGEEDDFAVRSDGTGWPRRIALVPKDGDASRSYVVEARALSGSRVVAHAAIRSGYVEGETRMLRLVLGDACIDAAPCGSGEACADGACAAIGEAQATSLPPWESATATCTMPAGDAGAPTDGGSRDGGGPRDGGDPDDAGDSDAGVDAGPGLVVSQVSLGAFHSCARRSDSSVWCWGRNGSRQLGDGTDLSTQSRPQAAVGLASPARLGMGSIHSCAIQGDGTAACWGSNVFGQIGNGTTLGFGGVFPPASVADLESVLEIGGGNAHTCAALGDGRLACWGRNASGQLGNSTTADSSTPAGVTGIATATTIAVGGAHSCARLMDGSARCWGDNNNGQLGDDSRLDKTAPVTVLDLTNVTALAAGDAHTCALSGDGSVSCWGRNTAGQLGIDSGGALAPDELRPVSVALLDDAIAIAAGGDSTCAIRASGLAYCWGNNAAGQLGTGSAASRLEVPTEVMDLTGVTSIALGADHGCAVEGGRVFCWGDNASGQLGTGGTPASSSVPRPVEL